MRIHDDAAQSAALYYLTALDSIVKLEFMPMSEQDGYVVVNGRLIKVTYSTGRYGSYLKMRPSGFNHKYLARESSLLVEQGELLKYLINGATIYL